MVDAYYSNYGGSSCWLMPANPKTYCKLIEAGLGPLMRHINAPEWFPTLNFNVPTSTNASWARPLYILIMKTLETCELEDFHGHSHYAIGNPDVIYS